MNWRQICPYLCETMGFSTYRYDHTYTYIHYVRTIKEPDNWNSRNEHLEHSQNSIQTLPCSQTYPATVIPNPYTSFLSCTWKVSISGSWGSPARSGRTAMSNGSMGTAGIDAGAGGTGATAGPTGTGFFTTSTMLVIGWNVKMWIWWKRYRVIPRDYII